jgi:hypothetical protein
MEEVKKAWQTAISRRPLILRTLTRTNIVKRDAEEWIARIDDEVLPKQSQSSSRRSMENS